MTRVTLHWLCLGLAVVTAGPLLAQGKPAANAKGLEAIRERMEQFVQSGDISGAVTLVGNRDGVLHHEAVGLANIESKQPMAKDTMFRVASMTKPITALAIMILADEGKLTPDDLVETHLPEFKGQRIVIDDKDGTLTLGKPSRPITLRDLMTHTSGLPGGYPPGLSNLYLKRHHTLAEATMAMSQQPLRFEPGSRWAYCNAGIDTLGRVVEAVSGQRYETFLQERIFRPLQMNQTTFYPNDEQRKRVAVTYGIKDGQLTPTTGAVVECPPEAKHPVPAAGLYSTARDMGRLHQAMLNGGELEGKRILSAKAVAEMTKLHTGELKAGFTDSMGFGYGWAVVRKPTGVTRMLSPGSFGHGGAFGTQGWVDPKRGYFVILMIQRTGLPNADASPIREALQTIAAEQLGD